MLYLTRITGEKIESIGITPIGISGRLFSSPVKNPRPIRTSNSASNFCFLSTVQITAAHHAGGDPFVEEDFDGTLLPFERTPSIPVRTPAPRRITFPRWWHGRDDQKTGRIQTKNPFGTDQRQQE